jgi:diguanylate cyclase
MTLEHQARQTSGETREESETITEVDALIDLAWACRTTDLGRTLELSEAAHRLARSGAYRRGEAMSLRNLGFCALRHADYEAAGKHLADGLLIAHGIEDRYVEAECLAYSAMVKSSNGDYLGAIKTQLEALSLRQELGDVLGQGQSLGSIGVIYVHLGLFEAALEYHVLALEKREQVGDENGRALTLNNIGVAYQELKDHTSALEYHQRSLECARSIGDRQVELYARINLGADHHALGHLDEAIREHRAALGLARELGNPEEEIEAGSNAGLTLSSLGRFDQALEHHREALALAREIRNPSLENQCLHELGCTQLASGQIETALQTLQAALEIALRLDLKRSVYTAHGALSEAFERSEDLRRALEHQRAFYAVEREVQGERADARAKTLAIRFETDRVRQEAEFERLRNADLARANAALVDADRQKSELLSQLAHQAQHDGLTGLPNRALFQDRLERAVAGAARNGHELAVMFIDLDGFKLVNDTLGHHAGDLLLVEVAHRLEQCLRQSDTVARMGGDEFTVILADLRDPEDAALVARKLIRSLKQSVRVAGHEMNVTASVGVSLFPRDGQDATSLACHADVALYRAKQDGKNDVRFFSHDMNAAALERVQLEAQLHGALERDELTLHYQPQCDAATGRVRSFEALLRWTHPELGSVPPDRFIPVAEDSGLIIPIGAWVLEEAARQVAAWREDGFDGVRVAINVSPVQFAREDFVWLIEQTLERYGLEGRHLEIELTERLIVRDLDRASKRLAALRALGVTVSIDDFGAGHSSLSYLTRLPVDVLKVDRSFVGALGSGSDAGRVVQAIVGLAHAFGLSVVAEGIETDVQLQAVTALGCERTQGYLLGRPAPALEAVRWLEGGHESGVRGQG